MKKSLLLLLISVNFLNSADLKDDADRKEQASIQAEHPDIFIDNKIDNKDKAFIFTFSDRKMPERWLINEGGMIYTIPFKQGKHSLKSSNFFQEFFNSKNKFVRIGIVDKAYCKSEYQILRNVSAWYTFSLNCDVDNYNKLDTSSSVTIIAERKFYQGDLINSYSLIRLQ